MRVSRAGLNARRRTRPAARPPRLDRLSRSAPFPMMWRQHSTAVLPRSCRGPAAVLPRFSRFLRAFSLRSRLLLSLTSTGSYSKMLDLSRSAYADAGRAWSAPLMQVAYDVRAMLLGRVSGTGVTRRPKTNRGKRKAGTSTRRAGEGLRASSHFSDNSIESSVRALTLGGGSGRYRASLLSSLYLMDRHVSGDHSWELGGIPRTYTTQYTCASADSLRASAA